MGDIYDMWDEPCASCGSEYECYAHCPALQARIVDTNRWADDLAEKQALEDGKMLMLIELQCGTEVVEWVRTNIPRLRKRD